MQWVVQLPMMSEDTYMSFEDYKARMSGKNIDTRPASEIIKDIEETHKRARKENNGTGNI